MDAVDWVEPDTDVGANSESDMGANSESEDTEDPTITSQLLPLHFFFDIETTGLDIYDVAIIELAGKVVDAPVPVCQTTFQSLVRTSKSISSKGKENYDNEIVIRY